MRTILEKSYRSSVKSRSHDRGFSSEDFIKSWTKKNFEKKKKKKKKKKIRKKKKIFVRKRSNAKKEYRQNNEGEFVSLNLIAFFRKLQHRSFFFFYW
jgi:hypothetical protein